MTDLIKENPTHVGWHSEPAGQGTWGILSSCLITMGLCVVTAIHLNIPASIRNSSSRCHRKRLPLPDFNKLGKWLLMGLFAPELVVYTAWNQFSFVRNITHVMKERGQEVYPHGEWTGFHSWYFLTGGFAFKTATRNHNANYVRGSPNLVLSRIGLNYMIEQKIGVLPPLHEDDIRDMGKADSLTKCIVCSQAVYIIAQSVARYAKNYPVSLLELNTVGHCMLGLMMYLFWFRKPKDVKLQTIINFKGADNFAAFLYFGGAFAGSICPGTPNSIHFLYGHRISEASPKADADRFFSATVLLTELQRTALIVLVRRFENLIRQIQTTEESLPFVPHKFGDIPFIAPGPIISSINANSITSHTSYLRPAVQQQ